MRLLLNDIALFIEVVNAGGFTQAAERLEMPPSTLSRRIAALERLIGFKLLNRTTRRVVPTAEGLAYHQRCQSLVEEATLAHEAIASNRSTVTGSLRLACTADFANLYLGSCIKAYLEAYPRVSVDLTFSSRMEDLMVNQLDMAIRVGYLRDDSLVVYPLGNFQLGVFASPNFLRAHPTILHPRDLSKVPCIRFGNAQPSSRWRFSSITGANNTNDVEDVKVTVTGRILAGGPQMAVHLTVQGLGIGLLDRRFAQPLVRRGDLVELLIDWQPAAVPVYAVTLSRLIPARVRKFIDLLKAEIGKPTTDLA